MNFLQVDPVFMGSEVYRSKDVKATLIEGTGHPDPDRYYARSASKASRTGAVTGSTSCE